ncbi:hypothetical protein [Streptomyces marincola]|uniref:hypothetical protein n=1 Tax=Streptomyces marincola TaxID=2878388 RepID=UPI001CF105FF|nr:hypothetical protein [Streptomyces marincola]UCM88802.1 hypothetical protein LC193_13045 [Streptomyces marincola]
MNGVLVAIEIDAGTVQRGDQIMIGGQVHTVQDMVTAGRGGKRLTFASGETFTMCHTTVLWAARRVTPRRAWSARDAGYR